MKQGILPEHMEEKDLTTLKVGEFSYTVPWSIQVDEHGRMWIPMHTTRHDEGQVRLERTRDGIKVRLRDIKNEKYRKYSLASHWEYYPVELE